MATRRQPIAVAVLLVFAWAAPGVAAVALPGSSEWRLASRCKGQVKTPPGPRGRHVPLSLIHIPRTGGTTIEDCTDTESGDDKWGVKNPRIQGMYHFERQVEQGPGKPTTTQGLGACYKQHLPASLLPEVFAQKPERETFCAVRDPYDRIVSQHGFVVGNGGAWPQEHHCNAEHLNSYVKEALALIKREGPYIHDCHFLPQAAYVFAWDTDRRVVDRSVRSCQHMLRFETLTQDFDRLMEEKDYPYRLNADMLDHNVPEGLTGGYLRATKSPSRCAKLKKEDLSEESRRLVEEHFRDDFELLGYQKLGV